MQTLIQFMGGEREFERRLDYIFMANTSEADLGANGAAITTVMNIGYVTSLSNSNARLMEVILAMSPTSQLHTSTTISTSSTRA